MIDEKTLSWDKYKAWVTRLVNQRKKFIYRGQMGIEDWKLQTTYQRCNLRLIPKKISLEKYIDIIRNLAAYYVSPILNKIINFGEERGYLDEERFYEFLGLLQHHGFPTPLLDWTQSPYIAAYFAFRDVDDYLDPEYPYVKVYVFNYMKFEDILKEDIIHYEIGDEKKKVLKVVKPISKYNPRVVPQQGIYTFTNINNIEDFINKNESMKTLKDILIIIKLSVEERPKVMKELDLMGINEMTLFPGLDGVCRNLKEMVFSRDRVGSPIIELFEASVTTENGN